MKKVLLSFVCLTMVSLTISAQSIVGKWQSETLTLGQNQTGVATWTFEPSGYAYQEFVINQKIVDGFTCQFKLVVPGLYYIEMGKSLTFNFDRDKMSTSYELIFDKEALARQGATDEEIKLVKSKFTEVIESKKDALMQECKKIITLSAIVQILYNDGNKFVYANPQANFWKVRNVLYRIEN